MKNSSLKWFYWTSPLILAVCSFLISLVVLSSLDPCEQPPVFGDDYYDESKSWACHFTTIRLFFVSLIVMMISSYLYLTKVFLTAKGSKCFLPKAIVIPIVAVVSMTFISFVSFSGELYPWRGTFYVFTSCISFFLPFYWAAHLYIGKKRNTTIDNDTDTN